MKDKYDYIIYLQLYFVAKIKSNEGEKDGNMRLKKVVEWKKSYLLLLIQNYLVT